MEPILSQSFIDSYRTVTPPFGFNGLGFIVYKRTYSRIKDDGTNEEWYETVARCVNGAQKIGAGYTKDEAERLYDHVFNLRCNFAGRMLWQLGTPTVDKLCANSLLNCWFATINEPKAFLFLFENLMLGGGVGFSVRREDVHELPRVKKGVTITHQATKDADFIVPDSRQGWVKLLSKVLDAYYVTGKSFTYSTILVRGAGEKISGFGGTASGPQILIEGIEKIAGILKSREEKKLRSIDALDICNAIGSVVVAGNVRRSAEIALGDPDDYLYLRAKNWSLGNVPNHRAMSNNTIYADSFEHISDEVWSNGYTIDPHTGCAKGEPYGFFNLPLSQKYGRIKDGSMKDSEIYPEDRDNCSGTNPCQPAWARVQIRGREGYSTIGDIKVGDEIACAGGWTKVLAKWSTGVKPVYRYKTESIGTFVGTENHRVLQRGEKVEVKDATHIDVWFNSCDSANSKIITEKIVSRELLGDEEVFDMTVDNESHTYWTDGCIASNCGEISLSSYECCNLSELYLNNITSKEQLIDCATLLYKTQKAIAAMPFLHEETNAIVHRNMRLGLGVTGVCQSLDKVDWLDDCYVALRAFDAQWSKQRGWPRSIKLTTIKPSGTLSLLGGATPGVHPAYSQFYIRRVRMGSGDKLVKQCRDAGYHVEYVRDFDGKEKRDTVVVEFPCKTPEGAILAKDMPVLKQLDMVAKLQSIWSDNAVSVTAYYEPDELPALKAWMKENYEKNVKSVSFLLRDKHGFQQAPYEEITEAQYLAKISHVKPLAQVSGGVLDGVECAGGACPVR